MAFWNLLGRLARKFLANADEIEKLVKEGAEVYSAHKKAKEDGRITTQEWIEMGKESYDTGKAFFELCKAMGWWK